MDRDSFNDELRRMNIEPTILIPESSTMDGFVLRKNHFRWEVFYRERGHEYEVLGFPSESDALDYLLEKITRNKYLKII